MSYLINPYRYASASAGCTAPAATYTDLTITQIGGCTRSPVLTATSVSHSLGSDTNLRFWVNSKLGNDTSSTFGAPACSDSGNTLLQGQLFTLIELQAGIAAGEGIDASDDVAIGWDIRCTAVDISDCATSICADTIPYIRNFSVIEAFPYNGPALYTDGSGTFPQFATGAGAGAGAASVSGATLTYLLQFQGNTLYYDDSSSLGGDSFGAGEFKIEIQYDTSCDTSSGCGSYSWQDGIDNDTFLAAGSGGGGGLQTFDVVEADCWDEDYLFIRYRIIAQGSCGTSLAGAWTLAADGIYDVGEDGTSCGPGGGP